MKRAQRAGVVGQPIAAVMTAQDAGVLERKLRDQVAVDRPNNEPRLGVICMQTGLRHRSHRRPQCFRQYAPLVAAPADLSALGPAPLRGSRARSSSGNRRRAARTRAPFSHRRARSSPVAVLARAFIFAVPTCMSTSGLARMLRYQPGCCGMSVGAAAGYVAVRMFRHPVRKVRRELGLIRISENFWRGVCSSISCPIAGVSYRAGGGEAQATAQSERIRPWLLANRFQAISQASMMSAKLENTELASQWLRR